MLPPRQLACSRVVACVSIGLGSAHVCQAQVVYNNNDPRISTQTIPVIQQPATRPIAPRVVVQPRERIILPRGQDNVIPNWTDTRVIMNPFDTSTKIVRVSPPQPVGNDGPGSCPTGHYWNGYHYIRYPWYTDWTGTSSYVNYNPIIRESTPVESQPVEPPVDVATLPPQDRAIALWSAGSRADAITAMREHLKINANDANALRTLAIIMLDDKRRDDAYSLMRHAYRADPALAEQRIDTRKLSLPPTKLRELIVATSADANKTRSASAWLTLAVLMQGEQRDELASKMLDRGGAEGLELKIIDAFKATFRPEIRTASPAPALKPATAPNKAAPISKPKPQ